MTGVPEEPYIGEGKTIEEAAENAAKSAPKSVQKEELQVTIYAQLSGEHNPIHGYRVVLGSGSP
jgi:hypothetical protein